MFFSPPPECELTVPYLLLPAKRKGGKNHDALFGISRFKIRKDLFSCTGSLARQDLQEFAERQENGLSFLDYESVNRGRPA